MADRLRLLLVAEDNVMRHAAVTAFSDVAGFEVEATDPVVDGIAQALSGQMFDVVLLWLQSTRGDREALVRAACSAAPETRVLIMVPEARQLAARTALLPGVAGCILSDAGWEQVVRALRAVAATRGGAGRKQELVRGFTVDECAAEIPPLTARQEAVLKMISDGLTYKQIASRLSVSPSVVVKEAANLFQLMRARNRVELVARVEAVSGRGVLSAQRASARGTEN